MGDREEARVERFRQGRESARLGRKIRSLLQKGIEASVGEGLGAVGKPWLGLKCQIQIQIHLD